ncbi:hypothetical protein [Enterococcus sp. CWB-B31]|uniref:hypothetical protein n=1 Tax=Enterococcus sp. CWB-B31 TaxID=2885159 RepID=UPI001E494450|nr:hypothetical protein [Enterococcus sp. CWB-B31]MCB5954933.1 hypothetical protein [Enterococcus sp. CWB-B31]
MLYPSENFATSKEAELHMYDIAGTGDGYVDARNIQVDINAESGEESYYGKVVVSAENQCIDNVKTHSCF